MTPEKQEEIKKLADELYAARTLRDARGAMNIYGCTPEEAMQRERDFQLADAYYIEVCGKMEAAKRYDAASNGDKK